MKKEVKISPILDNYFPDEMLWAKQINVRNDYYCGTISDNVIKMMKNVHEGVMETLKLNGYNSVEDLEDERVIGFCGLYVSIMTGAFFKSGVPYIFEELRKPKYDYKEHYKLNSKVQRKEDDEVISCNVEMREKSGTLKDSYASDNTEKTRKATYLNDLRGLLFETGFKLRGKKLSGSKINFTSWVNELLAEVAPEYVTLEWSAWNKILSYYGLTPESSHVIIKDFNRLREKLKNIYQKEVKIIVVE